MPEAIPALIVSGYLGSGKTTLVSHLLADAQEHGIRLAIISNEFGDTGIDKALLDAGADGLVELDGGCVCCRLSDALGETLRMILEDVQPDRLILETSGVALPGDVLVQFWRPPVDALVSEERVIILVDGHHFASGAELEETFLQQLETADIVLLNKCDLLEPEQITHCSERLHSLTGGRPVLPCTRSRVAAEDVFPLSAAPRRERHKQAGRPHSHERFGTEEFTFDGEVDPAELEAWLRREAPIRAKGFVRTADGVRLVQGVRDQIEIVTPPITPPDELLGRVVVIRKQTGRDHHG